MNIALIIRCYTNVLFALLYFTLRDTFCGSVNDCNVDVSGTLVSYLLLRELRHREGPMNINWLKVIIHRYWRYAACILNNLHHFRYIFLMYSFWVNLGPDLQNILP